MTPHRLAWNDPPGTPAPNGVGKRSLAGAGATLVRVANPAGASAARHSRAREQFVQVIAGSRALETDQGRVELGPGSLFQPPAKTWHAAEFFTDPALVETNVIA